MKTKVNDPPIPSQSANNQQNLAPHQLWQHLNQAQQQAALRSIAQICWQRMQVTVPQQQEVAHAKQ